MIRLAYLKQIVNENKVNLSEQLALKHRHLCECAWGEINISEHFEFERLSNQANRARNAVLCDCIEKLDQETLLMIENIIVSRDFHTQQNSIAA